MEFKDLNIKNRYRSADTSNIGRDFIEKVLKHSVSYKRAVGFFSSSSLIYTSRGLLQVADHYDPATEESVIKFIVSPRLTKEDIEAIRQGYKTKREVIESSMLAEMKQPEDDFGKERLNILCHLIASGAMEIKVAVTEYSESDMGMYHEKIGVMTDSHGNMIAFDGSLNESANAFSQNFESITIYKTWEESRTYAAEIENDFDELWANMTNNIEIYEFPAAVKDKLFQYERETFNRNIEKDEEDFKNRASIDLPRIDKALLPTFPYEYHGEAINKWFANRCIGIFDMATGAGKTLTAYGAMTTLLERCKYHLAVVIVAPYQHLVEQWMEDAPKFHINHMIVGYSNPKYANYMIELKSSILAYNAGTLPFFFFITTNASYKLPKVQEALQKIEGRALIVADEAHNFGSPNMAPCLIDTFDYRLALSATIERHGDQEGTDRIFNYFGNKCISYTLENAMDDLKLTQYEYHPIVVYLDSEERAEYMELSRKLIKHIKKDGSIDQQGKMLVLKRARIVAGANAKLAALRSEMKKHTDEYYMLVYCGTAKVDNGSEEESRQIDEVTRMLGIEMGMKISRYTSQEDVEERRVIRNRFKDGNNLQALVAIKCLDEGVNIPGIRTAFILASSTNPREYIQRRGRILRLAPGKDRAIIYDFVTLPIPADELEGTEESVKIYKSLVKNETTRMEEFGAHSLNRGKSDTLVEQIKNDYGLYEFENYEPNIEWGDDD